ncbi:polysaccharide lyase family 8 protein [Moniliophthora roreri MCA 2997]|uniref:Polysaccharide lyase family 8 protein n=1 Tax=Moniliophthora roreri (strain MCA 2997) TaxID=1381753 RepID=V2WPX8_MONRO|nr:polysaccharide lyase family 8 protein [Moniliophthora roreri MCA 2997]
MRSLGNPHYLSFIFLHALLLPASCQVIIPPGSEVDLLNLYQRRIDAIIGGLTGTINVLQWDSSLKSDGTWSDVNYATGCDAQRANWPAQDHWFRLLNMAGAWHGGLPNTQEYVRNETFAAKISTAMNWWFARDFTNPACLTEGGTSSCPCNANEEKMWNTNWFSNVIGTPSLVGQTCLLMNDTLSATQMSNCSHMTARTYGTFGGGFGFLAGANILDIGKISVDSGILTHNVTIITDAYRRVHNEVQVQPGVKKDGIKPDGSFSQHAGLLYNGNYGKDYTNAILDLEIEAADTQFAANDTSKHALETLFDGDAWMIYRNTQTGTLHWDFSALGRFISFPVIDDQATANIKLNLTKVNQLGGVWSSDPLKNFAQSLSKSDSKVNAGNLLGNRFFYVNDYMVHRGENYLSTVKMFSTRTQNTECTNSQNPLGFHLADGVHYNYIVGDEYEDIAASWNWNLIPGITVDYGATALSCDRTGFTGIEKFVGGVSDGKIGLAAMRYTNPFTRSLRFQKVWFFLDGDVQHVIISNIGSNTTSPVYSVLDQRRHSGSVYVNSEQLQLQENQVTNVTNVTSLWHGGVGYTFNASAPFSLSLDVGPKTGNWATIGTSKQPPATVDLFAAWLQHTSLSSPLAYSVYPGTDSIDAFAQKSGATQLQTIQNDASISAVYDQVNRVVMVVFWASNGGCVTLDGENTNLCSSAASAVVFNAKSDSVTVSDPSQSLSSLDIRVESGGTEKGVTFELPQGGQSGGSVTKSL